MKKIIKRIKVLRRLYDAYIASRYFNKKYLEIFKWAINSNEDTNYTYKLTKKNHLELIKIFEVIFEDSNFTQIKSYIEELEQDQEIRSHIRESTNKSELNSFADFKIEFSRRLGWYICVRLLKPKILVETGVDKGLGSLILIKAIIKNNEEGFSGYYYGTDINPKAGYLLSGDYNNYGKIIYGDSIETLNKISSEIDLFINDSDHSAEYEYKEYLAIKNKLSKKAIILGDNSHSTDKLIQFSIENNRSFLLFREEPSNHWYPGAGIGISYPKQK